MCTYGVWRVRGGHVIVNVHPVQVLDAQRQHFVLNGQVDEVVDEPVVARRELPGEVALDDLPLVVHHPRIADDLFGRVLQPIGIRIGRQRNIEWWTTAVTPGRRH